MKHAIIALAATTATAFVARTAPVRAHVLRAEEGVAAEPVVAEVAEEKPKRADKSKATPLADLVEGNEYAGKITGLAAYGAFVDIGAQSDGLVHISELSASYVDDVASVVKEGDDVTKKAGAEELRKYQDADPAEFISGTVRTVLEWGAFVNIAPGVDGLVHISASPTAASRTSGQALRWRRGQRKPRRMDPGDDIWENKDSFNWKGVLAEAGVSGASDASSGFSEKRGWTPAYVDAIYAMEGALRRANASDSPTIQRGAWQHDRAVGEHFSSRDAAKAAGQWRALRRRAALRPFSGAASRSSAASRRAGRRAARRDAFAKRMPATNKRYALKAIALVFCSFEQVLVLGAVSSRSRPDVLLQIPGSVTWPDFWASSHSPAFAAAAFGDAATKLFEGTHESGQTVLDKRDAWRALLPYLFMNLQSTLYYYLTTSGSYGEGDKETPLALEWATRFLDPPPKWTGVARKVASFSPFDRANGRHNRAPRDWRHWRKGQVADLLVAGGAPNASLDLETWARDALYDLGCSAAFHGYAQDMLDKKRSEMDPGPAADLREPPALQARHPRRKIIRCNRSSLYRFGVGCLVVFAAALAPFTVESGLGDLTADESRRATTDRTNGVMVGVVALLACDYARRARMRVGGSRDVVSTRLLLRLIALTVLFANAFARTALLTFAPVVLIWTEFPPLRNVVGAWRSHGATFLGVIAVFVSVLLLFAQLGVLLWADCYDSRMYADDDGADDGGELGVEFCVEIKSSTRLQCGVRRRLRDARAVGADPVRAGTTENAPFVMWPAVDCGGAEEVAPQRRRRGVDRRAVVFAAIAYFTAYIVVMVYVVVNFMLGSVYDAWHEGHVAQRRGEKVRRFRAGRGVPRDFRGRTDEDLDRDGCAPLDDASGLASSSAVAGLGQRRDVWRRKWRVAITAIVAAVRMRDADLGAVRRLCRSALVRASRRRARVEVAFDDGLVAVAFAGRVVLDPALAGVLEREWHVCSTSLKRIAGWPLAAALARIGVRAVRARGRVKLKRQIALFAMVFASVVYVYAAVGVALCGDVSGRSGLAATATALDDDVDDVLLRHRDRHVMDNRFAFSSFQKAWMTLIEIFLTNNWQDIVNAYLTSGVARRHAPAAVHGALLDLVDKYESLEARLAAAAGGGDTPSHLRSRSLRPRGSMTRGSSTSSAAARARAGPPRGVLAVARFRALGRVRSEPRPPRAAAPPPPMPWRASSTASSGRRSTRPSTTR
ncbi:hypothetical protein JL720_5236 [Aureococcus anophagefferens]|nr:hypothetical protein JL720_5236 [Aureococcus anophagefferens]